MRSAASTAACAPDLPYYYYHIPELNGLQFPMIEFLERAAGEIPNLAGIKYTHWDMMDMTLCSEFRDGAYDILHGRDEILICALALGIKGAVGSTYNIIAPLYNDLIAAFNAGDMPEARRLQRLAIETIRILSSAGDFYSGLKAVLTMLGLDAGGVRAPLQDIGPAKVEALRGQLDDIGFFDFCCG